MDYCHISPTNHLTITDGRKCHLVLAHLIEKDEKYVEYYLKQKEKYNCTLIMDNSAFEMYKQNKPMFETNKLLDMARKINTDYIVLSDYPGENCFETIEAAKMTAPLYKGYGFKTFMVPQGTKGDIHDLLYSFRWVANKPDLVDYIGVSILSAPLAYNVESNNKLQRFVSRLKLMYKLKEFGILDKFKENKQKIHLLGMVDGPNEIMYMNPFKDYINTWDSSAAVWLGLHDRTFDSSPTGLIDGKFEQEFDIYSTLPYNKKVTLNMECIDTLCETYLE